MSLKHPIERRFKKHSSNSFLIGINNNLDLFRSQVGDLETEIPVFFLDAHFTRTDDTEKAFFETQATDLIKVQKLMGPKIK